MYKIGIFSKMNRITVKTLRHYDDIGLLKPCHVDESTGYRYYSSDQLLSLHRIIALKQIGFSLGEIIEVMGKDISMDRMIAYLEGKQAYRCYIGNLLKLINHCIVHTLPHICDRLIHTIENNRKS